MDGDLSATSFAREGSSHAGFGVWGNASILLALAVALMLSLGDQGSGDELSASEFYPIGIYSVYRTNDLSELAQAGFNVVSGVARQDYLDAAAAVGLKVMAAPGVTMNRGFDPDGMRDAVRRFDRHPALWAWYLVDEPDLHQIAPETVREAHETLKSFGPIKPTTLVVFQGHESLFYANIADITMIDRYPIPWLPLANFSQHLRMTRLALGPDKPMIAVIQAHDWSYYPDVLPDEEGLRPPSYRELRCMTYCALAEMATGVFYYTYDDGRWRMHEHPLTWGALLDVVQEINDRLPLFKASHVWWPRRHKLSEKALRFNAALQNSVTSVLLRVDRGNDVIAPGHYVLCVNSTPHDLEYSFTAPSQWSAASRVNVTDEARTLEMVDGWVTDTFEPFDVHVYAADFGHDEEVEALRKQDPRSEPDTW